MRKIGKIITSLAELFFGFLLAMAVIGMLFNVVGLHETAQALLYIPKLILQIFRKYIYFL